MQPICWSPLAVQVLQKAIKYKPDDAELHLWYAQVLHSLKDTEQAKREYKLVLQIDPNNAEAKKGINILELYYWIA